jgi:transcriptional regulator with XRE-family HTH domain
MKVAAMAKAPDPRDELVRRNMVRFREEADLSQAQVGDLTGIPVDAIRRYEGGTTATVPGTVLSELAKLYGRSMDDFFATNPPKGKPDEAPVLFLRSRPGAEIDQELYEKIKAMIDDANSKMRGKKAKK